MTLVELKPNTVATIQSVRSEGATGERLMEMGFVPGTQVFVDDSGSLGQPMQLQLRGYRVSLRRSDAAWIEVST